MATKLKIITRQAAERAMSPRDLKDFKKSLSFGNPTNWPIYLTYNGYRWNFYNNYGDSFTPKRSSRKAMARITARFPDTEFLRVDAAWEAGVALYTRPFDKYSNKYRL